MSDLEFAAVLVLAASCILWIALDARREKRDRDFARHTDAALQISGPGSAPGGAPAAPRSSRDPGEGSTPGRSLSYFEWDLP